MYDPSLAITIFARQRPVPATGAEVKPLRARPHGRRTARLRVREPPRRPQQRSERALEPSLGRGRTRARTQTRRIRSTVRKSPILTS